MSNCRKFDFFKKYKKYVFSFFIFFYSVIVFAQEVTTITINNARRTEYKKSENTGNDSIFLEGNVELSVKKNDDTIKVSVKQYRRFLRNTQFLLTAGRI